MDHCKTGEHIFLLASQLSNARIGVTINGYIIAYSCSAFFSLDLSITFITFKLLSIFFKANMVDFNFRYAKV